jgi:hypothetical protein
MRNPLPATLSVVLIAASAVLTGCNAASASTRQANLSTPQPDPNVHYSPYIYSIPDAHNHQRNTLATQATLISRHPIH